MKSPNASYYLRGRGYRSEDFETMVSQVAGADMSDFFKRYVRRVETPPYEQAFAQAGLRFIREAKAASAFNHPNIAAIYDIGEADGLHFIVMEYINGDTLAARMAAHPPRLCPTTASRRGSTGG